MNRIQELFLEIDDDDSGLITDVEFRENVHMIKYYGLDETTCDLAFDLMDTEGAKILGVEVSFFFLTEDALYTNILY